MPIIEVKNLKKTYKIKDRKEGFIEIIKSVINPKYYFKTAVNGIDFAIHEGECVGYIGENGAGKSTTIKMLTGILYPTSGDVYVNGIVPYKNRIKNNKRIGCVFGQRSQLLWDLPVIESFKFNKKLYEIPDKTYNDNLSRFIGLLKIDELFKVPVRNLSLGQRMKCEIVSAFLHNPKVVYLDEPTIGLDVFVKEQIRKFIKDVSKERKTTVILTTHDLQDIEEVCQRIILIDNGTIVYDGDIVNFKNHYGIYRIIEFSLKSINVDLYEVLEKKKDIVEPLMCETNRIQLRFNRKKATANDIISIISKYCEIIDLSITEPNLELIVKDIYGREKDNEIC